MPPSGPMARHRAGSTEDAPALEDGTAARSGAMTAAAAIVWTHCFVRPSVTGVSGSSRACILPLGSNPVKPPAAEAKRRPDVLLRGHCRRRRTLGGEWQPAAF